MTRIHNPLSIILLCICFFAMPIWLYATSNDLAPGLGGLAGKVTDAINNEPIEFASINIYSYPEKKFVNGTAADKEGKYLIKMLPAGYYQLKCSFLGYKPIVMDSILIGSGKALELNLRLMPDSVAAGKEIVVSGEKSIFQNKLDKKVFDVTKSAVSDGGSAVDVLRNVPSVSVDADGNVSVRGDGNVTILIDGKPSGLTGTDGSAVLQMIPASEIETIEVITNPSAKYNPEGGAGIINIVLKKDARPGTNGTINLSAGTGGKYNGSAELNYRNNKINVFVNYGYRYNQKYGYDTTRRRNFFGDSTFYNNQNGHFVRTPSSHLVKAGLDYRLDLKNSIGFTTTYNYNTNPEDYVIDFKNYNSQNMPDSIFKRQNKENNIGGTLEMALNYQRKMSKKNELLTANIIASNNQSQETEMSEQLSYRLDNTPSGLAPVLQNTTNDIRYTMVTAQTDYVLPLKEKTDFETGAMAIYRHSDNNFQSQSNNHPSGEMMNDTGISNHFLYTENVYAAYAMYKNEAAKLNYQLGLRAEMAFTDGLQAITGQNSPHNYFSIFPTIHTSYEVNDAEQFQFSISRKIHRPYIKYLNPFTDYSDPLNLKYGNPDIKPEYIDNAELGYSHFWKSVSLNASLYYKITENSVEAIRVVRPDGVSVSTFQNTLSATNYGIELNGRIDILKWWNITPDLELYNDIINASNLQAGLTTSRLTFFANVISNMTIVKGFTVQVTGYYCSPSLITQGYIKENYSVDLGLRKEFMKGKYRIGLNVSDIFNTRLYDIITSGPNFSQEVLKKRETRIATLSFVYRFGNNDASPRKRDNRIYNDTGGEGE